MATTPVPPDGSRDDVEIALERERKRQRGVWAEDTPGSFGLASRILQEKGPEKYAYELRSNLCMQLMQHNRNLAKTNHVLNNQIEELMREHLALQCQYQELLASFHNKMTYLELSGIMSLAQETFDAHFANNEGRAPDANALAPAPPSSAPMAGHMANAVTTAAAATTTPAAATGVAARRPR